MMDILNLIAGEIFKTYLIKKFPNQKQSINQFFYIIHLLHLIKIFAIVLII